MNPRPLEGLRIVEFAVWIAGPGGGAILADLGAEVIKLEELIGDGDPYRRIGRGMGVPIKGETGTDMNPWFDASNYNKRFVSVNTKTPEGMEIAYKLIGTADAFVTSMRQQMLLKRSLDYDTLHAKFPKLPYAHFLGWGEKGPLKDKPGFDATTYFAQGGVLGNSAPEWGEYVGNFPVGFADNWSGITTAAMTMAGILESKLHGVGDYCNSSLYNEAFWTQRLSLMQVQFGVPFPVDTKKPSFPTINTYRTKDGKWMYLCISDYDRYYNDLMTAIDRSDLIDHPVYSKIAELAKSGKKQEIADVLIKGIGSLTVKEVHERFDPKELTIEDCVSYDELLKSEQAWENDFLHTIEYPTGDTSIAMTQPINMRNAPHGYERAKALGADNNLYLKELGYSQEAVEDLRKREIIA